MSLTQKRRPAAGGRLRAAVALATISITAPASLGVTKTWNGGTGTWETDGGWTPAGQPGEGDQVLITANASSVTVSNPQDPAAILSDLQISSVGPTIALLTQTASTLNTSQLTIGIAGRGGLNLTGGAFNVTDPAGVTLGSAAGGEGTLNISNFAILTATGQASIGDVNVGIVNQTGGRFIVTPLGGFPGVVSLGSNPGASGFYTLSGGSLESGSLQLSPFGGTASFSHNFGSVLLSADLSLGDPTLPGLGGSANYIQTGGGVVAQSVVVALGTYSLGSAGTNAGSLNTVAETLGSTTPGSGTFTQTAGTHVVSGSGTSGLVIGALVGTTGAFNLSGGTLTTGATRLAIAGSATFNQTGGAHSAGSLTLGPAAGQSALYTLGGSASLNVTTNLVVGITGSGNAVFTQTGGDATIGSGTNGLMVGTTGGSGTANLQGGTLTTAAAYVGRGATGVFNHAAGTHTATLLSLGESTGGAGTYTLSGGSLSATTLNVATASAGTFNHNAGTVAVPGQLRVGGNTGIVGAYTMANAATLSTGTEVIGSNGTGTFTQNGGTHTIAGSGTNGLTLGDAANGNGTFHLIGGTLASTAVRVGGSGNGTFNHNNATTHTVTGTLSVVPGPSRNGTYSITGNGTLVAQSILVGAGSGNALFSQVGGSTTADSVTVLPAARFNALGGAVTVAGDFTNNGTLTASIGGPGLTIGGGLRAGATTVPGITTVTANASLTADYVRQASLSLGAGAVVTTRTKAQGGDTSVLRTLTIPQSNGSATASLDLADNALVVDYTGGSTLPTIKSHIIAAYSPSAAAHWTAPGITSTAAAADANFALGYGEASTLLNLSGTQTANWEGQPVDATSVLVRFTLTGDATLDGAVDFNDLVKIAQNYNVTDGTRDWSTADFTYDGATDFEDLVKLAQHYNAVFPTTPVPGAPAGFQADLAAAFATVPEPTALGLAGIAVLFTRRRRQR